MQKTIQLKNILLLFLILFFNSSCEKLTNKNSSQKNKPTEAVDSNSNVNNWIYDQMKQWYLWTDNLPVKSNTDVSMTPDTYFESILYKPGEVDRFSWIQESSEELKNSLNGKNTAIGIRNAYFFTDDTKTKLVSSVSYVLKNSPAEKAGLKRGDIILKVNGSDITNENYGTIFAPENLTLTLANYANGTFTPNGKVISVTKAEIQSDPVQYYSVIQEGDKKIGYLVYTQYLSQYDDALRAIFGEFKAAGINELVLDLRYNGGGYISSAVTLTSLIGKGVSSAKVCYRDEWNSAMTELLKKEYGNNFFTKNFRDEPNNIGNQINRLVVLTTGSTASASELTINNLLPYMKVVLIGTHTYGKNVGSITIDDDQKRWDWGMQPIVLRTVNANGDSNYGTEDGFLPDIKVNDNVLPFEPLGNKNETLLNAALTYITNNTVATAPNARRGKKVFQSAVPYSLSDNPLENRFDMFADPLK